MQAHVSDPPAERPAPTTRERLLDAAARVIARDGYHGARLAEIAREAGLTTGAIYSNFRDKEELFLAAFGRLQARSIGMFEEIPSDIEGLISAYRQAAEGFEGSSDLQVLTFELALLGARNPSVRRHLEEGFRDTVAAYAARLPAAAGEREVDRTNRAALVVALGNGLELIRMFAPDLVPLDLLESALRQMAGAAKT
jgi:AcrR family transcriptional regulator